MLELLERNGRVAESLALFEIGPVFLPVEGQLLPDEPKRLAIGMWGAKDLAAWSENQSRTVDFYDLKGVFEGLMQGLHLQNVGYRPLSDHPTFHPGKAAAVYVGETLLGLMGEIHPLIRQNYDFPEGAILAAEIYLDQLMPLVEKPGALHFHLDHGGGYRPDRGRNVPANQVEALIRKAGGKLLVGVRLSIFSAVKTWTRKEEFGLSVDLSGI